MEEIISNEELVKAIGELKEEIAAMRRDLVPLITEFAESKVNSEDQKAEFVDSKQQVLMKKNRCEHDWYPTHYTETNYYFRCAKCNALDQSIRFPISGRVKGAGSRVCKHYQYKFTS